MPLSKKLGGIPWYTGIGLMFVCLVVIGAFYTPTVLESASHWLVFAGVSGFVFGYQLYDFWRFRATGRFWIAGLIRHWDYGGSARAIHTFSLSSPPHASNNCFALTIISLSSRGLRFPE